MHTHAAKTHKIKEIYNPKNVLILWLLRLVYLRFGNACFDNHNIATKPRAAAF